MAHTTAEITDHVQEALSGYELLKSFLGDNDSPVNALRENAIASFKAQGYPTTRFEEWKYTSIRSLLQRDYATAFMPASREALPEGLEKWWNGYENASILVFLNGHYSDDLSQIAADGPQVESFESSQNPIFLEKYGKIVSPEGNPFVALNTALVQHGIVLNFPKNSRPLPTFIFHLSDSASGNVRSHSRTFISLEKGAEGNVVDLWVNDGGNYSWSNHVSEVFLDNNAKLNHYQIQNDTEKSSLVNFTQAAQKRDSLYNHFAVSANGEIVRNDTNILHLEEHCESHLYGLYVLNGKEHVDNHTLVDHAMPNSFSNELYKGVLDGDATAVFNGKVMVRPDAQKTNAFQSNKTILLSEGATINTKPQLEIFADDVKCSHGATTGRLDEESLFYLRSRGIGERQARALLTYAFAAEVLEQVSLEPLKELLEVLLKNRLF